MRFIDFRPVDIDDAPLGHLQKLLEPGMPELWVEMAEQAFAVLSAHPALQKIRKPDLACCAISSVHQIMTEMGGEQLHIASAEKAFFQSMTRGAQP